MTKSINKILLAGALMLTGSMMVQAQINRTGYFLEDYTYRYQMNPAMANEKNFIAIPALGNLSLSTNGTLQVTDVLYNVDGRTTTFLNPKVSTQEVLSNIGDVNKISFEFSTPVIAFGFKGIGGYNTVSLSAKAATTSKIPGSIFSLLKEGISNKTYDIGAIHAKAYSYAELAFGHSHKLMDGLRIGANVKVLIGAGNIEVDMKHADLQLGTDDWRVVTEGDLYTNLKGAKYETDVNSTTGHTYVSGIDYESSNAGITGLGFAVDLGAVYDAPFLEGLQLSASLLDLGFINWSNTLQASTKGQKVFSTDKYTFNVDDNAPNSFDNEIDIIKDEFSSLYELDNLGDTGSRSSSLGATLNIGGLYTLPVYKAMKFGLLNTTRINGDFSWTDFRVSANWTPCRVFDAAVSTGVGTFGANFGWLLNLHCSGISLFLGMDQISTKFSKDMIPLGSDFAFNMGLNILF